MPSDINIKGRYGIFAWPGYDSLINTYNSQLCVVRRVAPVFFSSVQQYIPGLGNQPFTSFQTGSAYTVVTRSNSSDFNITNLNYEFFPLKAATIIKNPIFTVGLDRESIFVAISSYIYSNNNPIKSIVKTRESNGFYNNLESLNIQLVKELNIPLTFTHFEPNSGYELRNNTTFILFAPLKSEMGTFYGLGNNTIGQFGMGHLFNSNLPLYRSSSTSNIVLSTENIFGKWQKIVENQGSVMALSANGNNLKLFVCGDNTYGQLGLGNTSTPVTVFRNVPGNFRDVMPGKHSLAIDNNGMLYSCGLNTSGQLGLGHSNPVNTFTQVNTFNSNPINTNTVVNSICVGDQHSMVRAANGSLYTCGNNTYGQLGLGDTTPRNIFTLVPSTSIGNNDIGVGPFCSAFISAGSLWVCGSNFFNLTQDTSQQFRLGINNNSANTNQTTFTIESNGFTDIQKLWIGSRGIFVKRSNQGFLWACGVNHWGALGIPTSNELSSGHYYRLDIRTLQQTQIPSNFIKFFPSVRTDLNNGARVYPFWISTV